MTDLQKFDRLYRTETRTGTTSYTDPDTGETVTEEYEYEVQVPYTYYICTVELENFNLSHVPVYIMSHDQLSMYATYIPHFLSEVVVCSLVILFLNKENGVITDVLCGLGMERKNLLGVPEAFPWIYSLMGEWQGFGWSSILYISALAGVPQENVEAATIDGANRFQIIRHINIPAILPTIIITFILKLGGLMNVGYSKIYLLQNSLNLPSSRVISTYVYEIGLIAGQYSYSTAIGLFNTLVNVIIVLSANAFIKKISDVGLF